MTPYRVGLTGGLASGKSTVAGWLRDAGFEVVDADQLVAELYRPRAAGAAAARDLFGPSVLTPEGGVDHRALADHVFGDAEARRALEQAIHPLVRHRFDEIVASPPAGTSPALPESSAVPLAPNTTGAIGSASAAATPASGPSGSARGISPLSLQSPAPGAVPTAPTVPRVVVLEATLLIEAGYAPGFDLIVTVEADPEVRLRRAVARGMREEAARARLAAQGDGDSRRRGAQRLLTNDGDLGNLRRQVDALITDIVDLATRADRTGGRDLAGPADPPQAATPAAPAPRP